MMMTRWIKKRAKYVIAATKATDFPKRITALLHLNESIYQLWVCLDCYYVFTSSRIIKIRRKHLNSNMELVSVSYSELAWWKMNTSKWNSKHVRISWGYHNATFNDDFLTIPTDQNYFDLYQFLSENFVSNMENTTTTETQTVIGVS